MMYIMICRFLFSFCIAVRDLSGTNLKKVPSVDTLHTAFMLISCYKKPRKNY